VLQEAPDDLECQRADVIARAVKNKKNLLRAYRAAGFRTILLLEGKDGVLANRKLVFNALRPYSAQASPDIDDVYFISTWQGPPCVFRASVADRAGISFPALAPPGRYGRTTSATVSWRLIHASGVSSCCDAH
jgi:hypothetical protein